MNMKERIVQYRKWIVVIVVVLMAGIFLFDGEEGLTQSQFEEQLKELSDGAIVVTDIKTEKLSSDGGMYFAKWNGISITASTDDNKRLKLPFLVTTQPSALMDEIALGQYQQFIQCISQIADPSLSESESEHLISNELNFNNQIMTAETYSTSKNELVYELGGGQSETSWFTFMITTEEMQNKK